MIVCSNCKIYVAHDSNFCKLCGKQLNVIHKNLIKNAIMKDYNLFNWRNELLKELEL